MRTIPSQPQNDLLASQQKRLGTAPNLRFNLNCLIDANARR